MPQRCDVELLSRYRSSPFCASRVGGGQKALCLWLRANQLRFAIVGWISFMLAIRAYKVQAKLSTNLIRTAGAKNK